MIASPSRTGLNGIDAPDPREPFGTKAKQITSELAFGKTVTVVPLGHDRYGRTIGDVFLPDNRLVVQRYALDNEILKQLETDARKPKRGLWADTEPVPPWEWRREQTRTKALSP